MLDNRKETVDALYFILPTRLVYIGAQRSTTEKKNVRLTLGKAREYGDIPLLVQAS